MSCGPIESGQLRSRVQIQTRTRTTDSMGGATVTWAEHTSTWAEIVPKGANEAFWAKHLEHRVTHKITIRYLSGITSDMRILFGTRVFQIKGILNWEEKNRYLILSCEEGVAA